MATVDRALIALSAVACVGLGCSGADGENLAGHPLDEAPHWSYDGELGPERWHELDVDFTACGTGTQQSPIDIPAHVAPAEFDALRFDYAPAPATLADNGHTIQVDLTEGANVLELDGEDYSLLQFHFHAHSEHSVDGVHLPLELHLVHRGPGGALAAVGVLLDLGEPNAPLAPVFDAMATATREPALLPVDLDPAQLLPPSRQGWAYAGSLTTPPCTEGVSWHVMSTALQVSPEQLDAFTARHQTNRRPIKQNTSPLAGGSNRR